jgi:hypothetical protein
MIPAALKAGSVGLRILRTLYGAKAKISKASKATSNLAAKKGYAKTSKSITGVSKKTHTGTKLAKKYIKKYPKSFSSSKWCSSMGYSR